LAIPAVDRARISSSRRATSSLEVAVTRLMISRATVDANGAAVA